VIEPEFGYARAPDGAYIAYETVGEGPDLFWQADFLANVDVAWEDPWYRRFFTALASFARLTIHDRRATGLSSRDVGAPNLETRVADMLCVMDAVGAEHPVLGGERETGAPSAMLVATYPGRARSLIWYAPTARSTWAPDYPWGAGPEYVDREREALVRWGTSGFAEAFVRAEAALGHEMPLEDYRHLSRWSRHTTTPDVARELSRIWYETDIRPILPAIRVPTLLMTFEQGMANERAEAGFVATEVPGATLALLPGAETDLRVEPAIERIRAFLGVPPAAGSDAVLATVLFTDIVDSTTLQARLGDRGWKDLIERHHELVRDLLGRYRGIEQDTAGDGFFARFDGPARAIRCAQEIVTAVRSLGLEVRGGLHTGECELADDKCAGLAVSIGARVMARAGASEVLVSQTVKDLVAGSGLTFEDAGEHELKGVPDRWRLYRVVG
jgi:class 3 adenylate cyclase